MPDPEGSAIALQPLHAGWNTVTHEGDSGKSMTHNLVTLSASAGMLDEQRHNVTHALSECREKELADHASYHLLLQRQDLSLLLRWQTLNLSW